MTIIEMEWHLINSSLRECTRGGVYETAFLDRKYSYELIFKLVFICDYYYFTITLFCIIQVAASHF